MSEPNSEQQRYAPPMAPDKSYVEINAYVIGWGLFFAALFALAVGYLCLKIGQTVDAFAPVSVLAMGMAVLFKRKNAFPETVHIQAIASAGTNIIGGVMFILPALFILQLDSQLSFAEMVIPIILGGVLGVLLATTFRRYFCEEMDAAYPFPSGRAAAEVLSCNEGSKAKVMVFSGLLAMAYDFVLNSLGWWQEVLSTMTFSWGQAAADKYKLAFSLDNDAALLGIGYFTGLRYAAIIAAGSFFSWFVCIPVVYYLGGDHIMTIGGQSVLLANASIDDVFSQYVRHIGIGMLAMAGIIGIVRSWGIIKSAVSLAASEMKGKKAEENVERTQKDLSMKIIAFGSLFTLLLVVLFFYFDVMQGNILHTVVAILLVAGISFLFTTVAANAIAIVGTNPVSGMTLMTLILASVIMVAVGLKGATGMVASLVMGGVVCTALSMAGGFITDLKIGYWLGSTPKKQESWKFLGTLVSAATVGGVIMVLNDSYGFTSGQLAAPQANAMAAVIDPLMNGVGAPWLLYGIGAALALVLTFCKVPALAFALGMFIPLELNLPLLVGGAINWYVTSRSKDEAVNNARGEKGTLLASGFIAGGALMGVVSAIMRYCNINLIHEEWLANPMSELVSLVAYLLLITYLVKASMKLKK